MGLTSSLSSLPDAAIGSISAALIGAFIGYLGLVIAKENKVSEFRQAWIDGLRKEVAEVVAHFIAIRAVYAYGPSHKEFLDASQSHFVAANIANTAIRTRLNPGISSGGALLQSLDELENLMSTFPLDIQACQLKQDEFIRNSRVLLASEWVKVERGEMVFAASKWIGLVVALVLLGFLVINWALSSQSTPVAHPPLDNSQSPTSIPPAQIKASSP